MLVDSLTRSAKNSSAWGERADRLLTHKAWGSLAFLGLMALIFQAIYSWAQPVMQGMERGTSWLGGLLLTPLPAGLLKSLLADGVIAGAGSVLVFLPQIAILFLFIALLEDCGYMARGAFLMDRLFARLGLSGRSFIPLLSSFACAIPGVLATRTIPDKKERLAVMLVAPLMSCSARLPVYTVMIGAFVPDTRIGGFVRTQALVLLGFYLLGLAVAIPIAWVFKKRLRGGVAPLFLIELPSYKWPEARTVLRRVTEQCREFVVQAGTVILSVTVILWALSAFPRPQALLDSYQSQNDAIVAQRLDPQESKARLQVLDYEKQGAFLRASALGRLGHLVEPIFRPLGWDWRISLAALASFPAREVVIGTLGTIFNSGSDADEGSRTLRQNLTAAKREDGRPLFTLAVALSLMVFFALCAQCASTLAVISRESGHWGWAAFVFAYMTVLAWAGGALTYQVASRFLGWG
jgi:ferrous iron transport protein B